LGHGGVVDLEHLAVAERHAVAHARRGGDEVDLELALQPLLHNLQVQQAQEAAAEAEAERDRVLRFEVEGAVVQPQLFERVAQHAVFVRFPPDTARRTPSASSPQSPAAARRRWGRRRVIVSPILASDTVLMLANRKPTSPAESSSQGIGLGDW
jgi:hypothetical protein